MITFPVCFTIYGVPRTKKNSMRSGFRQSKAWEIYERTAKFSAMPQLPAGRRYNVKAIVYRNALRGDLLNYLAGTSDIMEMRGVVHNDVEFVGWDGSRMYLDRNNPRVEITITEAA